MAGPWGSPVTPQEALVPTLQMARFARRFPGRSVGFSEVEMGL